MKVVAVLFYREFMLMGGITDPLLGLKGLVPAELTLPLDTLPLDFWRLFS